METSRFKSSLILPFKKMEIRKRYIRRIGTSHYVKLEPIDLSDLDVKAGDFIGVSKLEDK